MARQDRYAEQVKMGEIAQAAEDAYLNDDIEDAQVLALLSIAWSMMHVATAAVNK